MTRLEDTIFNTIDDKKIEPYSRSLILLRRLVFWTLITFSIILGALSFATVLYISANNQWDTLAFMAEHRPFAFLHGLPFLWLLFTAILMYGIYKEIRSTKTGHHYEFITVVIVILATTGVLGFALYSAGFGHRVDQFSGYLPGYRPIEIKNRELWTHPEHGIIAGYIIATSSNAFILEDFKNATWTIVYATSHAPIIENARLQDQVRILGVPYEDQEIHLCAVMPWQAKGTVRPIQTIGERKVEFVRSNECEAQFKLRRPLQH